MRCRTPLRTADVLSRTPPELHNAFCHNNNRSGCAEVPTACLFDRWRSGVCGAIVAIQGGRHMKRIVLGILLASIFMAAGSAIAAEGQAPTWRYNAHSSDLPFPRGKRAESIWASGACWSECGSYCAWGLAGCLKEDSQGRCLKLTDKCDRYCQRECRTMGGPFLPIEFPWE